jgi:outer membrane protein insertion porin family
VSLQAQEPGPIVRDIVVEFVGPPSISKARVIDNLATRIGSPYTERAAEADIRTLYATGGVANVRIFAEPYGDGVRVTVLLQGRPVIEEIIFEGAEQLPLRRVRREVGVKVGDVLTEEKLEADRLKIVTLYENKNFADVDVQYRIEEIAVFNQVRVIFQITEGPRLIVRRINFSGMIASAIVTSSRS